MLKIRAFFRNRGPVSVVLSVIIAVLFVVTAVNASTTISTNINTGGTLTVTGVGHLQADLNIYGNDFNLGTGTATSTLSGGFGIGVGTTTPGAAFAVATSTAGLNTAFLLSNLGSNYTFFAEDSANDTSPFVIDAGGNVGIGSSSPASLLGLSGASGLMLTNTGAVSTVYIEDVANDTSPFLIDAAGTVGVGTTTPWAYFSINPNQIGTGPEFAVGSSTKTDLVVTNAGRVGVGSTTPFVALGVTGTTTSSAGAIVGDKGSAINQILFGSCTLNPGFVQASSTVIVSCTGATNVSPTDKIFITATQLEYGLSLVSASSTAVDAISIAVHNNGNASTSGTFGTGIDPITTSVSWMAIK